MPSSRAEAQTGAPGVAGIEPINIVVMGVCGCGKSSLGEQLAAHLDWRFVEGDGLHPARNVALMAAGTPLTDADRQAWLEALAALLQEAHLSGGTPLVLSCSALKRRYRDLLRRGAPHTRFIHLHGAHALLESRLAARQGHYMPPQLLASQLEALEPLQADEAGTVLDLAHPLPVLLQQALQSLPRRQGNAQAGADCG